MNSADYIRRKQQRASQQFLVVDRPRDASTVTQVARGKAAFAFYRVTKGRELELEGTNIPGPVPRKLNDPSAPTYVAAEQFIREGAQYCNDAGECGGADKNTLGTMRFIGQQIDCSQPIAEPNPIKGVLKMSLDCPQRPRWVNELCCPPGTYSKTG